MIRLRKRHVYLYLCVCVITSAFRFRRLFIRQKHEQFIAESCSNLALVNTTIITC
jgi:hypothetical protein